MTCFGFVYSTVDGHTRTICERLAEIVKVQGYDATLHELDEDSAIDGRSFDLTSFDRVVIGASVRYGKHRPEVARFIKQNLAAIEARDGAFFSVSAIARKAQKKEPHTNPYVRKFFEQSVWRPTVVGIFAGRIHYAEYGFLDRTIIRFIMWLTNGPTALDSDTEFTDWNDVADFADKLCRPVDEQVELMSRLKDE